MRAITWMLAAAALTIGATPSLAKAPTTWDGLVHVDSKKVQAVYLLPNADFRGYTQVMFDPPQVAFRKNWRLDYNSSEDDPMAYVSSNYVTKAVALAQQNLAKVFPESFGRAGITVASAPGPHVLRLAVYIVDLTVAAPDVAQDMSSTFSVDAGTATFAIEARDSQSGQLLGRAVDAQAAGDNGTYRRTYSSNVSDFEALFKTWAQISAKGFDELRTLSPINTDGMQRK
jgi:hypothetical protein